MLSGNQCRICIFILLLKICLLCDLRNEFEANPNYAKEYLRPNNDNVHFTKAAAQYVAGRVWDIAKEFKL